MGNGDGTFADPVDYLAGDGARTVAVVDLDGDGRQDLVSANETSNDVTVLMGNGDGTFAGPVSFAAGSATWSLTVGDFDGDGRPDIVSGAYCLPDDSWFDPAFTAFSCPDDVSNDVTVLMGNGDGTFRAPVSYPVGPGSRPLAVGDLDGDGTQDLVSTNVYSNDVTVLLGKGDGTFAAALSYAVSANSVAVSEMDRDGHQDLVTAAAGVTVLLGHGDGTFEASASSPIFVSPAVAVGDFDEDGAKDVVSVSYFTDEVKVLLGNGEGSLAEPVSYEVGDGPVGLALGDLDGNGHLDVVVTIPVSDEFTVLLGNGDGTFEGPLSHPAGNYPRSVAVGDFDSDGRQDLVLGTSPGATVLLGNGDGTFATAISYAADHYPQWVAVGDFDGDGREDLVIGYSGFSVLLGNGDGTFSEPVTYNGMGGDSVAVGDFDGDGQQDLVSANGGSNDVTVLLGNGDGTFAGAFSFAAGNSPRSVALGDLDGNGSEDLVTAGYPVTVLLNQSRSVWTVALAIKPESSTASINPFSRGVIPVAILGSDTFDVADVDVATLAFGPAGAPTAHNLTGSFTYNDHLQDVNLDGYMDLVAHFRTRDTGIACGDESATLTGELLDGRPIEGTDSVNNVGCRNMGQPLIWLKYEERLSQAGKRNEQRFESSAARPLTRSDPACGPRRGSRLLPLLPARQERASRCRCVSACVLSRGYRRHA